MHVQYKINPAANGASITVMNKGKNVNIFFCIGSVIGEGFSLCCKNIVIPIKIGRKATWLPYNGIWNGRWNKISGCDKSLIQNTLLNKNEIDWLNKYHFKVYNTLKKYMNKNELVELKKSCSNI